MKDEFEEFSKRYIQAFFDNLTAIHNAADKEYRRRHPEAQAECDKGYLYAIDVNEWSAIVAEIEVAEVSPK